MEGFIISFPLGPSNDPLPNQHPLPLQDGLVTPRVLPVLSFSFLLMALSLGITGAKIGGAPLCYNTCRGCLASWEHAVSVAWYASDAMAPAPDPYKVQCGFINGKELIGFHRMIQTSFLLFTTTISALAGCLAWKVADDEVEEQQASADWLKREDLRAFQVRQELIEKFGAPGSNIRPDGSPTWVLFGIVSALTFTLLGWHNWYVLSPSRTATVLIVLNMLTILTSTLMLHLGFFGRILALYKRNYMRVEYLTRRLEELGEGAVDAWWNCRNFVLNDDLALDYDIGGLAVSYAAMMTVLSFGYLVSHSIENGFAAMMTAPGSYCAYLCLYYTTCLIKIFTLATSTFEEQQRHVSSLQDLSTKLLRGVIASSTSSGTDSYLWNSAADHTPAAFAGPTETGGSENGLVSSSGSGSGSSGNLDLESGYSLGYSPQRRQYSTGRSAAGAGAGAGAGESGTELQGMPSLSQNNSGGDMYGLGMGSDDYSLDYAEASGGGYGYAGGSFGNTYASGSNKSFRPPPIDTKSTSHNENTAALKSNKASVNGSTANDSSGGASNVRFPPPYKEKKGAENPDPLLFFTDYHHLYAEMSETERAQERQHEVTYEKEQERDRIRTKSNMESIAFQAELERNKAKNASTTGLALTRPAVAAAAAAVATRFPAAGGGSDTTGQGAGVHTINIDISASPLMDFRVNLDDNIIHSNKLLKDAQHAVRIRSPRSEISSGSNNSLREGGGGGGGYAADAAVKDQGGGGSANGSVANSSQNGSSSPGGWFQFAFGGIDSIFEEHSSKDLAHTSASSTGSSNNSTLSSAANSPRTVPSKVSGWEREDGSSTAGTNSVGGTHTVSRAGATAALKPPLPSSKPKPGTPVSISHTVGAGVGDKAINNTWVNPSVRVTTSYLNLQSSSSHEESREDEDGDMYRYGHGHGHGTLNDGYHHKATPPSLSRSTSDTIPNIESKRQTLAEMVSQIRKYDPYPCILGMPIMPALFATSKFYIFVTFMLIGSRVMLGCMRLIL